MWSSRREFLRASGAAIAGLAAAHPLFAEPADAFGGFVLGIQTYTFRKFKLEQALKRTQDLGLKYVELYSGHVPITDDGNKIKAVRKLCGEYDIAPVAFGVEEFTKNHDANKRKFEFGKALGLKTLSANPTPDSFDSLDKLVDEYKISIGIHPHGPDGRGGLHRWYSAEVIMKAVKDHHPLIGACLDTGHLIRAAQLGKKLDPAAEVRVMGARNFGVHLKDHDNKQKHDVVFGQGVLNVPEVLKALREVKFAGYISIEYEHHEDDPSPDLKDCVAVFKESVKKLA